MENDYNGNKTALNNSAGSEQSLTLGLVSSALLIFWMVVFIGFLFSLVTTLCLLFTKEVRKGNMYITLSTMTFSELIVYLTFLILLGLTTFPRRNQVPYLCLFLNTIVGLFKAYSLSLAVYLSAERVMALSCRKVYLVAKKKNTRIAVKLIFFALDSTFYFGINFHYGSKDTDAACTISTVYPGDVYEVMSILRASAIPKMVLILILCAATSKLIKRKMRKIMVLAEENTKSIKGLNPPDPDSRTTSFAQAYVPSFSRNIDDPVDHTQRSIVGHEESGFQSVSDDKMLSSDKGPENNGKEKSSLDDDESEIRLTKKANEVIVVTLVNPKKIANNPTNEMSTCSTYSQSKHIFAKRETPLWMKESFKTVSHYLFSYIIVYLPSILYMTVMICFPHIKEDAISRGINFLTPCVHSCVASFLYIYKVKEIREKFKCTCC